MIGLWYHRRMQSKAKTVDQYLASLPADRREVLEAVRAVVLKNLSKEYEEGMQYGMIGYFVPHSVYAPGYHCDPKQPLPFAGLASQKNHTSMYLMCAYNDPGHQAWFRAAWAKTGKKLGMGKACIRFKKLDDVPLQVIGEAIRRIPAKKFIEHYESAIKSAGKRASNANARKGSATATTGKSARKSAGKRPTKAAAKRKT